MARPWRDDKIPEGLDPKGKPMFITVKTVRPTAIDVVDETDHYTLQIVHVMIWRAEGHFQGFQAKVVSKASAGTFFSHGTFGSYDRAVEAGRQILAQRTERALSLLRRSE